MSDPTLEAIRVAAQAELKAHPIAREWTVDALVVLAVNAAMGIGALAVMSWGTVQHAGPMPRMGTAALLTFIGVAGVVLGVRPGAGRARLGMLAFGLLTAGFAILGGSGSGADVPLGETTRCAEVELGLALLPLLVSVVVMRGFAFDPIRAVVLGMAAGAPAVLALHLHCANGSWAHLATMHVAPWLVLAGVTMFVRRSLSSRSFAP